MGRSTSLRDKARALIARDQPPCHICGGEIDYRLPHLDPMSFVVDHVVPIAAGGADRAENWAAAHRACNRAKADKEFAPIIRRSGTLARPR